MKNKKKELKVIAITKTYENGKNVIVNRYGRIIAQANNCSQEFLDYIKKTETWEKDITE